MSLNKVHQGLLDRVENDTMGCEEAVKVFFRGRYFDADAALKIAGALMNRERFARQMQDKYAIEGDLSQAASWEDIGNKWQEAFTNVYEMSGQMTVSNTITAIEVSEFDAEQVKFQEIESDKMVKAGWVCESSRYYKNQLIETAKDVAGYTDDTHFAFTTFVNRHQSVYCLWSKKIDCPADNYEYESEAACYDMLAEAM